jgi:hypothetical protein
LGIAAVVLRAVLFAVPICPGKTLDMGEAKGPSSSPWAGDGLINLQGLAEMYWNLYKQPRAAWTHESGLGTHKENF